MNFVRMRRSLILGSLVAVLFASTTAGAIGGGLSHASAEALVSLTKDNAALFLPENYEQYLALASPVSAAMSEDYIAIADSSTLYIYDRAKNEYTSFSHFSYTSDDTPENISKVQIAEVAGSDNDRIFFSDNGHLYEYTEGQSSKNMIIDNVSVQTFLIDNASASLFTAQSTTERNEISIHRYSVKGAVTATQSTAEATIQSASSPNLALENGILYVAYNDTNVARFQAENLANPKYEMLSDGPVAGLQSVCAFHGNLYYTVKNESDTGGLFRCTSGEAVRLPLSDNNNGGLSALTVYKDELYCIRGTSVLKLDVKEDGAALCDYEITAGSASVNRLNGATDCVRAGDLLVTADKDNDRISVYDLTKKSFEVLPCDGVQYVATDGERIAAASNTNIFIFENMWNSDKGAFALSQTATIEQNNVNGLACVYDAFYFVTQDYYYGVLTRGDGNWTAQTKQRLGKTPTALTANLYGDIFVADDSGSVYKLGEDDFCGAENLGTPVATIGTGFSSLRAGFDGTLYFFNSEKQLCMNDGSATKTLASIDGKEFVYTKTETAPVSFALGFEDDEAYFCFGDFIVKSNAGALGLPLFGRLLDAADIVRAGDLLVTADTGNNRVTVYDMKKHSFAVIQTDFPPTFVATDGSVIAAASGNNVYVCKDPSENPKFDEPVTADLGTIKGLACVNGTAYYITEYGYGKVEEEDKGLVSRLESSLIALTVDDKGILYVVDSSGHVRYYYEDEFADPNVVSGGYSELCLHTPISSLRADSEGNLYYLS